MGCHAPDGAPDLLPELERAVIERRQVVLGYRDREQQITERTVHPLGLVSKGDIWYLLAHTDAGMRTFRIGRVQSALVTDAPAVRPADFDLADAWQSVVSNVRELRTQVRVTIRLDHRHVWPLRGQFGDDLSLIELAGDAERHQTISCWRSSVRRRSSVSPNIWRVGVRRSKCSIPPRFDSTSCRSPVNFSPATRNRADAAIAVVVGRRTGRRCERRQFREERRGQLAPTSSRDVGIESASTRATRRASRR